MTNDFFRASIVSERLVKLKRLTKKVVLVGEPGVGKTSLVRRFVLDSFDDKYIATIGVKVSKKTLSLDSGGHEMRLNLMIYDVLGQHDFRTVRRKYIEGSDAAILVADLTTHESIEALESFWIPEIEKTIGPVPMALMGNKLDLVDESSDEVSLLRTISNIISSPLQLCSAKTGQGVEEGFDLLGRTIIEAHLEAGLRTDVEEPIENLRMAADRIMTHFCEIHGDEDAAMEICSSVFMEVGFDPERPERESLMAAIELLAEKERPYLDEENVSQNTLRRLVFIREAEEER